MEAEWNTFLSYRNDGNIEVGLNLEVTIRS